MRAHHSLYGAYQRMAELLLKTFSGNPYGAESWTLVSLRLFNDFWGQDKTGGGSVLFRFAQGMLKEHVKARFTRKGTIERD